MRGIRIAAFAVAAILACVVISHMFSIDPAADEDSQVGVGSGQNSAPPVVPAPPPVAGEPAAQPVKKRPVHAKVAVAEAQPVPAPPQPVQTTAAEAAAMDAKPVIFRGNELRGELAGDSGDGAQAPASTVIVADNQPKGPVIVVPHERPKEESRGSRWLKAVGHALGIGGPKNPVDQAFQ